LHAHPAAFSQAYLVSSRDSLGVLLAHAADAGFSPAVKLVRGAYLEGERARAATMGLPPPTQPSLAATAAAFDGLAREALAAAAGPLRARVLFGTHNVASIEAALAEARRLRLVPEPASAAGTSAPPFVASAESGSAVPAVAFPPPVAFAQLYGMRDGLTHALAEAGLPVLKYLPFGVVADAVRLHL